MSRRPYELIGSAGCGSAIVEMALAMADVAYTTTDLPYLEPGKGRDRLLALNPLGQVPTLVLPDESVLTESAAMILHIGDVRPASGLVPLAQDPERAAFLNLLILLVGAVYPTFTFADDPAKWTLPGEPADTLKQRIDGRKLEIYRRLDRDLAGGAAFAFGSKPTAVDLYLAVLVHWRPGFAWFRAETPRLVAIAEAVAGLPVAARILERHFGEKLLAA